MATLGFPGRSVYRGHNVRNGSKKQTSRHACITSAFRLIVLLNVGTFADGFFGEFLSLHHEATAAAPHQLIWLMRQLRQAGSRCQGRWPADELRQPPKILSGGREQHLVPRPAQAAQPKSIEPQNALHMRKAHLDLLALAA